MEQDTAHDVIAAAPGLDPAARAAVAALALRQAAAAGPFMRAVTALGGQIEGGMRALPAPVRARLDEAARKALAQSYDLAGRSRGGIGRRLIGDGAHRTLATLTGAAGGFAGLAGILAELPVATTVIFRAVQDVAAAHGEDPQAAETRLECLRVFGAGGPGAGDDGIDTSFFGTRLALTGTAVNGLLARVAPRVAAMFGQKLATGAVPVLGAVAGAGANFAFTGYYIEMAHVHFGLRRLARLHGEAAVTGHFHRVLEERARLPSDG
ncbi:MAG: EcsC family protein [Rubellimicrobium sp.]|nr:EcsC family protein [Rubellimicrobium sp.]